ncbi:MAG: S-methyl-5'-thioadenosine phosphorylase [Thermodesulfobacteriota bacterium]
MFKIGVIGGSGLYEMDGLENIDTITLSTPWGDPSDQLVKGNLGNIELFFLPRHEKGHKIMPSDINYRANIYAMKMLDVDWIISVSAVGSMKNEIAPGNIVVPTQFIDFTKKRESTFFGDGIVAHVSMANPVCPQLSQVLFNAAFSSGATVHMGGTYICIEGPQFSTKAESELFRQWNVDVIGMTNMPEAKLAREAEICYTTMALSTDYDCWHEDFGDVSVGDVIEILHKNVDMAKVVIQNVVELIPEEHKCNCKSALENSIITSESEIKKANLDKISLLIEGYLK